MGQFNRVERRGLKQCSTQVITDCGLTLKAVQSLVGNPAGVGKADVINPDYRDKVSIHPNGQVVINIRYVLTGHIPRAKEALKNIERVYKTGGVLVNFITDVQRFDLRIHGAQLIEFVQGLKLCDCKTALYIGGWGPSHKHYKWGKALLVNPHTPKPLRAMADAHEFGHKLGLKHRTDRGLMDYPPKTGRDRRQFIVSDKKRIVALYKKGSS